MNKKTLYDILSKIKKQQHIGIGTYNPHYEGRPFYLYGCIVGIDYENNSLTFQYGKKKRFGEIPFKNIEEIILDPVPRGE